MKILLIEDEKKLSEAVSILLEKRLFEVDQSYDGLSGFEKAVKNQYHVILLDIMLANMNGFEVLEKLRLFKVKTPIIMLTANSRVQDKIRALNKGADDYIEKPFQIEELIARIKAVTRRSFTPKDQIYTFPEFSFNYSSRELIGKQTLTLTELEAKLLRILIINKKTALNKDYLINELWGVNSSATINNLEVYVSFLRKKINDSSIPMKLETIRGIGYRLVFDDHV